MGAFLEDEDVKMVGVEPAGRGLTLGKPSVIHGMKCYTLLDDETGEPAPIYCCASGLHYPAVGPQHSFFKDSGRVEYQTATDKEVINAFFELSRSDGIIRHWNRPTRLPTP